jgi:hypothetical protein
MGTSNWQNISYNIGLVRKLNPASILDAGAGFGRWGILFREFLEIWDGGKYDGKWERTIDAVEIYEPYLNEYHRHFYNNIFIENALDFLKKTDKRYDLINLGDIVEHFSKNEGFELIELSLKKGKYVLITIPIGRHWGQTSVNDNPYEEHKSIWYNNDFTKYRYCKIKSFEDQTLRNYSVVLLSNNRIKYDKRFGKYFFIKNILKHKLGLRKFIERYENGKRKS